MQIIYILGIIAALCYSGMVIVRVRSNRSWLSVFIPGLNYYTRTQIAGRPMTLSIITSLTSNVLLLYVIVSLYRIIGWFPYQNIGYNVAVYIDRIPQFIINYGGVLLCWGLLQIWVNWGVAHRRGRGLLSGIELTILPFIFWPMLGLSSQYQDALGEDKNHND